jgi:hypothetical protein
VKVCVEWREGMRGEVESEEVKELNERVAKEVVGEVACSREELLAERSDMELQRELGLPL